MTMDGRDPNFLYANTGGWTGFHQRGLELDGGGALRLARVPLLASPVDLEAVPAPDGPAGLAVGPDGTVRFTGSKGVLRIDPCDGSIAPDPCYDGPAFHLLGLRVEELTPPWTLARDPAGNVWRVDVPGRRVLKFTHWGAPVPSFWENASGSELQQPVDVAVGDEEGEVRVYVLDARGRVFVFDASGEYRNDFEVPTDRPLGLAFADGSLFVGDNRGRALLVLRADGTFLGEAEGFEGPVAALALDGRGGLWLHPGGTATPLRLELGAGHIRNGTLWSRGPFGPGVQPILWHRLEALGGPLPAGAHLQLYVHKADTDTEPAEPFGDAWSPLPLDALQGIVRGAPAKYLRIAAHLTGEGRQSPALAQIRVEYDAETWARHLPAIYRTQSPDPELLERFLALFESVFTGVEREIEGLSRLFDAQAAPAAWLPWLAGWLDLTLDERWPEAKKREAIAGAFAASARRGTPAGLREAVRFATGVDVRIVEPVLGATWWVLPAEGEVPESGGRLGFDTVLSPAGTEGAVVGTTAVLDGSYLEGDEGPGAHLYEGVAHQFCVHVYERQVAAPGKLAEVRAVLDREKPAHTAYHLCVIKPHLRVGFQARVGVDTIVAGPAPATRLGSPELVLGGDPPGRIGSTSRLGLGTRLGDAVVEG
jgi:phage tail-like protein